MARERAPWDLDVPTHDAELFGLPYPCSICRTPLKHRVFFGGREDVYCPQAAYLHAKMYTPQTNTDTDSLECCLI